MNTNINVGTIETRSNHLFSWAGLLLLIYLLIASVSLISTGFIIATMGRVNELFEFATNPFFGLLIGILVTSIIQSSSSVTAILVALVAGGLPVSTAVPIVFGANIGTTVTNTILSLAYIRSKDDFRRTFPVATIHDFFNIMCVLIFFPLEIIFHPLEKAASYLSMVFVNGSTANIGGFNFIKYSVKPFVNVFKNNLNFFNGALDGVLIILIGIAFVFISLLLITRILKNLFTGRAVNVLKSSIGKGPVTKITTGTAITAIFQSSSVTSSLVLPFAGAGLFTVMELYPFILGANIGTTVTALLTTSGISGSNTVFAVQIALVHFLFNFLGVVVVYGIPTLRKIPLLAAVKLADAATERKWIAALYIFGIYFALPGLLLFLGNLLMN